MFCAVLFPLLLRRAHSRVTRNLTYHPSHTLPSNRVCTEQLCVLTTAQNKLRNLCLVRFRSGLWRGRGKGALGGGLVDTKSGALWTQCHGHHGHWEVGLDQSCCWPLLLQSSGWAEFSCGTQSVVQGRQTDRTFHLRRLLPPD